MTGVTMREIETDTDHESVIVCRDPSVGYHGIIAIHSTVLGPAVGGARLWRYPTERAALDDALRLSRGMTYKCAMIQVPFGGGKSVIIGDPSTSDRRAVFRAHGRFVERLGGRYITAEDVGTSPADMEHVRAETRHVAGLADQSGDPSPYTARGVLSAMLAAAQYRWDSTDLAGRTVALQGCGHVGQHLARALHRAGARLVLTDIEAGRARHLADEVDGTVVAPDAIYEAAADIFAPCALGGILNDETIPRLRVSIVAGATNNQLLEPRHGAMLAERGILYTPDYVANAGGVLSGCRELLGWDDDTMERRLAGIFDTVLELFTVSDTEGILPHEAADRVAERAIAAAPRPRG